MLSKAFLNSLGPLPKKIPFELTFLLVLGSVFLTLNGFWIIPATGIGIILLIDACILLWKAIAYIVVSVFRFCVSHRKKRRAQTIHRPANVPAVAQAKPAPPKPEDVATALRHALSERIALIDASGLPEEDCISLRNELIERYRRRLLELM